MAKAEIFAGACGITTNVKAKMDGRNCNLEIESSCKNIQHLSEELKQVDPYQEISFQRGMPKTYEAAFKHIPHAACPVPSGIIKAIEVEAKLALPRDVSMKITRDEE